MQGSGLDAALARIGDRWSLLVVQCLLEGPRRFGELAEALPGIASNVLAQRLRHLEGLRLVVATPYSQRPRRLAYGLSAAGRDLAQAVEVLAQWGAQEVGVDVASFHLGCGTPLEVAWFCPTCATAVAGAEAAETTFL